MGYLAGAVLLLAHLLWQPGPRPIRRYAGMSLDMLTLTAALALGEATAAIFYPFYLWVTFGMGFRYGRRYLFVSAAASLLSFALVIALTEYWRRQPALAAGLWFALLVLPAYASSLLTKLTDALARAEEASQTKSRFLATMSHELRTPLHAIIGMADLLRGTPLAGEQQEMVRTVRSAGHALHEMIGELLDVARLESEQPVRASDFDLHALLASVRALLHHEALEKGLALHLEIDPAVPYRLHGARRSLQQILVNLTANAVKFTARGSVRIRLGGEALGRDRVALRIDVEDTGIGIRARGAGADLRALHAGRRVDHAAVWRHRARARDRAPADRAARRLADRRERTRSRRALHFPRVLPVPPGPAARTGRTGRADRRARGGRRLAPADRRLGRRRGDRGQRGRGADGPRRGRAPARLPAARLVRRRRRGAVARRAGPRASRPRR